MQMPKYIPQFDYLRAVAVLVVMLFHASHDVLSFPMARYMEFGWTGVDLFFVLSGFLITGILLGTREQKGYFTNFYARRILRIWPSSIERWRDSRLSAFAPAFESESLANAYRFFEFSSHSACSNPVSRRTSPSHP